MNDKATPTVTPIRPEREVLTKQRLPYFVGISGETVGARGLSMHMVVIPPGAKADPHSHRGYETGIYVLEGRVETRYGAAPRVERRQRSGRLPLHPARRPPRGDQPQRHRAGTRHRLAQRPRRARQRRPLRPHAARTLKGDSEGVRPLPLGGRGAQRGGSSPVSGRQRRPERAVSLRLTARSPSACFHAGSCQRWNAPSRLGSPAWRSVPRPSRRTSSKLRLERPSPRASRATSICRPPGTQPANSA